mmetsp:Transcript_40082/g.98509  ORF Transcript_40082/g.98509 Transcript_40082/m.98509 type:complete len:334 (-) Transcript_40082:785-1786(-)
MVHSPHLSILIPVSSAAIPQHLQTFSSLPWNSAHSDRIFAAFSTLDLARSPKIWALHFLILLSLPPIGMARNTAPTAPSIIRRLERCRSSSCAMASSKFSPLSCTSSLSLQNRIPLMASPMPPADVTNCARSLLPLESVLSTRMPSICTETSCLKICSAPTASLITPSSMSFCFTSSLLAAMLLSVFSALYSSSGSSGPICIAAMMTRITPSPTSRGAMASEFAAAAKKVHPLFCTARSCDDFMALTQRATPPSSETRCPTCPLSLTRLVRRCRDEHTTGGSVLKSLMVWRASPMPPAKTTRRHPSLVREKAPMRCMALPTPRVCEMRGRSFS